MRMHVGNLWQWAMVGILILVLWATLVGCSDSNPSQDTVGTGAEPTGGSWRTIVLANTQVVPVPAPPSAADTAMEIEQLLAMQGTRTPQQLDLIHAWDTRGAMRWNELLREMVSAHNTAPPLAARAYAMLSVAQYDAMVACWAAKYRYQRPAPATQSSLLHPAVSTPGDPVYPCEHAVLAGAAQVVLTALYPDQAARIAALAQEEMDTRLWAGVNYPSDIEAGRALGSEVAQQAMAFCNTDGADTPWAGSIPEGPGYWHSSANPPTPPLLPGWGTVRPWLMTAADQFRADPPPAFGSAAFDKQVAAVRQIADTRTAEQVRIAEYWADGAGTPTPPGHWNAIGCDLLAQYHQNELRAVRTLALLNRAEMDASICCWDSKYTYWLLRPSQADPAITMVVPLPNFPSFTSGHSTFSGAAATVLAYVFPRNEADLRQMARDASLSRVDGGIHYPMDCEIGLLQGNGIGELAVRWGRGDGAPQ